MLRIYFLQQWFNLSDPAVEEALYDSPVMRQFVGIDLGHQVLNGHSAAVVGFAQIPGKAKFPGNVTFEGATIPILFQGIAWIDESNFRIVRLRTDMLAPRPDIYLQMLTREVLFSEVRIQADETPESFWLPEEVEVVWDFRGQVVRQLHRYSDYHLYHAKSKIVM
jgi:hypothetical protein